MPKFGRLRYVRFVSPDRGRMSSKYPCKNTWYYASHDMLYTNAPAEVTNSMLCNPTALT